MVWLTPAQYNVSNFSSLMMYVDYLSSGWLGILFIMAVFTVAFIGAHDQDTAKALAFASLVSGVLSVMLRVFGLLTTRALLAFVIFAIIAAIYYKLQDE